MTAVILARASISHETEAITTITTTTTTTTAESSVHHFDQHIIAEDLKGVQVRYHLAQGSMLVDRIGYHWDLYSSHRKADDRTFWRHIIVKTTLQYE